LKVPGSHASPATAGAKIEPEAGRPARALVERAVQTVAVTTADAAVGDFPVDVHDGLRGPPTKSKRRKRRRERAGARLSAPEPPISRVQRDWRRGRHDRR